MSEQKPVILSIDDDPGVSRAVQRDLRRQYGEGFRVMRAESGSQGLELLGQVRLREEPVALLVADQRMPRMTGVEFLERAIGVVPEAKRVLLTAYADTQVAIDAINRVSLDHYLMKPWDPPEEQLYPVLDDLLSDWEADSRNDDGIRVVGHRWSRESHELKDFLARSNVPYRWLDLEREPTAAQLNQVWTNLIDNAIDAVDGAGTVRIATRRADDQVVVSDDGPGVPPELQSRLFEPFFTTKDVGKGTGLGLDVVYRIVTNHRGQVRLESKPGDTRFQVRLPLDAPGPPV